MAKSNAIRAGGATIGSSGLRGANSIEFKLDWRQGGKHVSYILIIIFWLIPGWAIAQDVSLDSGDRLSVLQGIMPNGAVCSNLDWEPVSYCRYYSKGATLEVWTGANGPGASLSFDASGNEGIVLLKIIRKHFSLLGIPIESLNRCIHHSEKIRVDQDRRFSLSCNVVELSTSVGLEIIPAPSRSVVARQK